MTEQAQAGHKEIHDILLGAAAALERGWCQGNWAVDRFGKSVPIGYQEVQCRCLVGAVRYAHYEAGTAASSYRQALKELNVELCERYPEFLRRYQEQYWQAAAKDNLITWNDRPERTQEEVVALVRATLERLKGRGNGDLR